jgi:VanZ family protein
LYKNRRLVVSRAAQRSLRRSAAPLAWMAVIFVLSAQPDLSTHLGIWDLVGRKLAHIASYALLTWLWFWALRGTVARPMASAVVISLLYAVSDEYHQHFVHGRHGSPVDVAIDSIGIGLVVWWKARKT